jgi:hypothetical protein
MHDVHKAMNRDVHEGKTRSSRWALGVPLLVVASLGAGPCDPKPPSVPITPPPPPTFTVECRRNCGGDYSYWRELPEDTRISMPGIRRCEQQRGGIERQPISIRIQSRAETPEERLAECVSRFDEPIALSSGLHVTRAAQSWIENAPSTVRDAINDRSCTAYGPNVVNLACEPPGDDALVGESRASGSPGPAPIGGASGGGTPCEDDHRGHVDEPCTAIPAGCGTDIDPLPGVWKCTGGTPGSTLKCVVDERSYCPAAGSSRCGNAWGQSCTRSTDCGPGLACTRDGHCENLPAGACHIPTCWPVSETASLCPVSDEDPSIPAGSESCTDADEGEPCTGTALGCGEARIPGTTECVAGAHRCVLDPDAVRTCGASGSGAGT